MTFMALGVVAVIALVVGAGADEEAEEEKSTG
jgi:hypothetical protein